MQFRLVVDGDSHQIETDRGAKGIRVRVDGAEYRIRVRRKGDAFLIRIGTKLLRVRFEGGDAWIDGARYPISISGFHDELASRSETAASGRRASLQVRAPMPGRVVRILAEPGAHVKRGQTLVVLEAMKMQNEIPAPRDGIVREVPVVEGLDGRFVGGKKLLFTADVVFGHAGGRRRCVGHALYNPSRGVSLPLL